MTTLTDFLLARIAEDEKVARASTAGPWVVRDDGNYPRDVLTGWGDVRGSQYVICEHARPDDVHIARHNPARILAECEAKRRIVTFAWENEVLIDGEWGSCRDRAYLERDGVIPSLLITLAAVYADHPDYQAEWAIA